MKSSLAAMTLFFGLSLVVACGAPGESEQVRFGEAVSVEGGEYREVSVPELRTMLELEDFPLINVHIPFEGDLPGTDLSIPYNEIEDHLDLLPADRNETVFLYCRSDGMSAMAAEVLVRHGYTDVYHLRGGFNEWSAQGLPLEGN